MKLLVLTSEAVGVEGEITVVRGAEMMRKAIVPVSADAR